MRPISRRRESRAAWWYRKLLSAYPPEFRARFGADLEELFADLYRKRAKGASLASRTVFWTRIVSDTLRQGLDERLGRRRHLPFRLHHVRGASIMSLAVDDIRHAIRALRHQPGFAAVIVVTLSLAIGANSAIFTVVNALLLRPLPYFEPDRVVMVYEVDPRGRDSFVSLPAFDDLQRSMTTLTGLSLMAGQTVNLTGVPEPERLRGGFVTADFFAMLGVRPVMGRALVPGEDLSGAPKVAVLAYRTWQQRFGRDPAVIGHSLILNNEPHEVVGVLPSGFEFPIDDLDVWMPYSSYPIQDRQRTSRNSMLFGRIPAHVSFEQAQAELEQIAERWARAHPASNRNWSARFQPFHDVTMRLIGRNLRLLTGALAFVLLVACANIANLLLARASGRHREMAVRAALGASRARLVTQLLAESVIIASVGGALGLIIGALMTDGMLTLLPNLPRANLVRPDATVVAYTAALSVLTGIVFGTLPALRTSRPDLRASLNEGGRGGESRAHGRLRAGLVICELALSLILLVGAGLFIQSLTNLQGVELGYNPARVLSLEYRLPRNKYATSDEQWDFHRRVIERIGEVPGVEISSLARAVPQSGNGAYVGFWKSEDPQPPQDAMPRAQYNAVSEHYFGAMEIPVLAGRVCGAADTANAPLTIIVNRFLADRLWRGDSPVGKRLRAPDFPGEAVVVGVVGNTRPQLLSQPIGAQIYGCLSQQPGIFASVIAKTTGEPMALARSVQQAVWSVDPDQPVWKIRSSRDLLASTVQRDRFVMLLMSFAAALAVLVAGLGTYGVLSYTVRRRAREVGIRMALGATRASIVQLVVGQTAGLTLIGIALGLGGAIALARVIETQLYEVSPKDPRTFFVTAVTLATVAFVAAWLPTRQATSVDPVVTLRTE